MAEDLTIVNGDKASKYESLYPQIKSLIEGEDDLIANLSNISAALKEQFGWLWVGFYLVKDDQLVLGPFQGPVACTRINFGKGVCGKAWELQKILLVPDVEAFPGHIACSSSSRSEVVVPLIHQGKVVGVLDVDSEELAHFNDIDLFWLEKITSIITFNEA